jgi:hypothetical protein
MMEIGDCFENIIYIYKVVKFLDNDRVCCNVYLEGRFVGITSEHPNTLFNMKKLSSLEKELM